MTISTAKTQILKELKLGIVDKDIKRNGSRTIIDRRTKKKLLPDIDKTDQKDDQKIGMQIIVRQFERHKQNEELREKPKRKQEQESVHEVGNGGGRMRSQIIEAHIVSMLTWAS